MKVEDKLVEDKLVEYKLVEFKLIDGSSAYDVEFLDATHNRIIELSVGTNKKGALSLIKALEKHVVFIQTRPNKY